MMILLKISNFTFWQNLFCFLNIRRFHQQLQNLLSCSLCFCQALLFLVFTHCSTRQRKKMHPLVLKPHTDTSKARKHHRDAKLRWQSAPCWPSNRTTCLRRSFGCLPSPIAQGGCWWRWHLDLGLSFLPKEKDQSGNFENNVISRL